MLVPFAQEKRDFEEAIKQMKTGTGLKIASFASLAVRLGVLFSNADNPYAWRIPLSIASVGLGFTGLSLRKKGYNRINSSIYRYNYQINSFPPSASLGWTDHGLGLSIKF